MLNVMQKFLGRRGAVSHTFVSGTIPHAWLKVIRSLNFFPVSRFYVINGMVFSENSLEADATAV
jgi:hypothetical protein